MLIFNKSWNTREVPGDQQKANVVPIFKEDKQDGLSNYRSVSLTSILSKVMECLVQDLINKKLQEDNIINTNRHGYMENSFCQTTLIPFFDEIINLVDKGISVAVIYLDFFKTGYCMTR